MSPMKEETAKARRREVTRRADQGDLREPSRHRAFAVSSVQMTKGPENQKAHEVTRDVTAWAWPWAAVRSGSPMSPTDVGHSGIGPVLLAICSRPGTRPGPFSRLIVVRRRADRRFDRGCIRRDRSPNRVAWRCTELEGRGISRAAQARADHCLRFDPR